MGGAQHIGSSVTPDPKPYRLRPQENVAPFESVMHRKTQSDSNPMQAREFEKREPVAQPVKKQEARVEERIDKLPVKPDKVLKKILKSLGLSEAAIEKIASLRASGELDLEGLEGLEAIVMMISAMPGFETPEASELAAFKGELEGLITQLTDQLSQMAEQTENGALSEREIETLLAEFAEAKNGADEIDLEKTFHQVKKAFETQEKPIQPEMATETLQKPEKKPESVDSEMASDKSLGTEGPQEQGTTQATAEQKKDHDREQPSQKETKITVVDRRTEETPVNAQVLREGEGKTPPVKTAETPFEQLVKQHKVFEQVKNGVMDQVVKGTVQLDDGSSEMTLRLKPAQLGEVHLKLSIEKGVVLAEMRVASEVVKQAIESQLADLKQSLSDKGFGVAGLNVSVNKDQTDGRGGQPHRQQTRRPLVLRPEKDSIPYDAFDYVESGINAIDYLG